MTDPPDQPPRTVLIKWMRLNLALSTFFAGMIVSGGSALIGVGAWFSDQRSATAAQQKTNESIDARLTSLESDRHERDQRRVNLATDLGVVNGRLGVVESKLNTLGELLSPQRTTRR